MHCYARYDNKYLAAFISPDSLIPDQTNVASYNQYTVSAIRCYSGNMPAPPQSAQIRCELLHPNGIKMDREA